MTRCRIGACRLVWMAWLAAGTVGAAPSTSDPQVERRNWFDDPFFQIASGLPGCPVPLGPFYTEAERRMQMHSRLERGTSCWLEHRCEDSNAYRYDKVVAPRVRDALAAVPGLKRASVWVTVQRRWVYLQGCVPTRDLAVRLERAARGAKDVETVVPDLMVGTRGRAPYPLNEDEVNARKK
ncbi:BON domain-containing protein [Variovorax sp. dw_308]|uniref:BON domain-containing protein n=1 Tax=Variovorax sp. dw_308 TaxID=2721546 RepID=UPI00210BB2B0|nr:BON domain-containing protein [Variovorax sp. dw_308]